MIYHEMGKVIFNAEIIYFSPRNQLTLFLQKYIPNSFAASQPFFNFTIKHKTNVYIHFIKNAFKFAYT